MKTKGYSGASARFKRLPIPILMTSVLATFGTAAYAQTAPDNDSTTLDRVTVTGSNLRRADAETPSPVQVLTLDEIKQSGYTDISDVLHNLSANGAGTLSQSFGGAFAAGASGIALRGLSVGATLVLIDGHRPAPNALSDDGERSFVDISQIPLEAIDRIEVLKDGASSIYGSDAIAGVINVILKKSYVGGEASAEYGQSKYNDARIKHVTNTYGFGDLEADGHNAYIALEYREQDPAYVANRPYLSQTDFSSQGGNNLTFGVPTSLNGGLAGSTTGYLISPITGTPTSFFPGCNATAYANGQCAYTSPILIQTPTQNINVLGSYTQNLPDGWQLNVKASLFDEHTSTSTGPISTTGATPYVSTIFGPGVSPGLYAPGGTGVLVTVPATYPGNTTGAAAPLQVVLGRSNTSEDSQNYRFAADLTGSLFGFDITASAGYSENLIYTEENSPNYANLQALLNNPATPYRVGTAAYLNSAAANALVIQNIQGKADNQLSYVTLDASREVYDLPGGPLSVGVGVDYRHQSLDAEAPPAISSGFVPGNNAFAVGTQNVAAVYAEAAAPIFKWLEVDASVRHDSYAGSFSNTDPKIGFKITPIEQIAIRGTYAEGFRAPNPAESGNAGESFLIGAFPDAVLCPNGNGVGLTPGNYPAECTKQPIFLQESNPNLKPEKSHSYTAGLILEPIKGYSVSLDYYNITIDNQIVGASADPNFFGNVIGTAAGAVRSAPSPETYVLPNGTLTTQTPPVGAIAYFPVEYINASKTQTSGVDLDARAKFNLWNDWGKLTFDLTETHVFHYVQQFNDTAAFDLAGTHGPSEVSGDTGNPRDRAQFVVTYDRGPLTVTGTTNWTSGFSANDPSQGQATCQDALDSGDEPYFRGGNAPSKYCRIHAYTEFDLYANYRLTKAFSVHASILNLFNQNAPLDYATYGGGQNGSSIPYGPSFAQEGAIGRFFTVGAQYRF